MRALLILIILSTVVRADSFFFTVSQEPDLQSAKFEGDQIVISTKFERVPTPKVKRIEVVNEGNRQNLLRAHLTAEPPPNWFPMIKLEEKIIEIYLFSLNAGPDSYFEIEFSSWEEAVAVSKQLAKLVNVPDDQLKIEKNTVEQGGTGQPTTRPESESKGSDKPQPDAEGCSR
jgi:hypothetical protein